MIERIPSIRASLESALASTICERPGNRLESQNHHRLRTHRVFNLIRQPGRASSMSGILPRLSPTYAGAVLSPGLPTVQHMQPRGCLKLYLVHGGGLRYRSDRDLAKFRDISTEGGRSFNCATKPQAGKNAIQLREAF
jgi:hypothetical protein